MYESHRLHGVETTRRRLSVTALGCGGSSVCFPRSPPTPTRLTRRSKATKPKNTRRFSDRGRLSPAANPCRSDPSRKITKSGLRGEQNYFPSLSTIPRTGQDILFRSKQGTDSLWPPTRISLVGSAGVTSEERGS